MKKILWTGGWDSTFRLLQLVLIEKIGVQPIYIKDADRKSHYKELEAINSITENLRKNHPEAIKRINALQIIDKNQISIDQYLQECFNEISKTKKIGAQYLWIASFCKQNSIDSIELCIEKDYRKDTFYSFILPFYEEGSTNPNSHLEKFVHSLFDYFSFNLFNVTKMDMLNISKEKGWMKMMDLTWFCHRPKKNKPCGKCNPCIATYKEGLRFRIPKKRWLQTNIKIFKKKLKKLNGLY